MSITLDHLNIDLDGDGIPERYELGGSGGGGVAELPSNLVYFDEDGEDTEITEKDIMVYFSDLDYSEEEQLTGKRWPDGRPVYEKTFVINGNFSSGQDRIVEHNIENLDLSHIILTGSVQHSSGTTTISRTWDTRTLITTEVNSTKLMVYTSSAFTGQNAIVVMQYAKTTDTAQSPVRPAPTKEMHTYDDTEKIVGTWIDGKPLYEKSYVVDHGFSLTSNSFNNIVACDIPIKQLVFHSIADPTLSLNLTLAIFSNGYIQGASTWPGSLNINANAVLTIQYTKTTD